MKLAATLLTEIDFDDLIETETNEAILTRWGKYRPGVLIHNVIFEPDSQFIRRAANYIYVFSIEGELNGNGLQKELQNDCRNQDITYEAVGVRFTSERCPKSTYAFINRCPPEKPEQKTKSSAKSLVSLEHTYQGHPRPGSCWQLVSGQ